MTTPNIPIIQGQKTLLIGLGSTGARVCNQILERMVWEYQSPKNIPWVRCLVIETANIPTDTTLYHHADLYHLSMKPEEYAHLINNPSEYKETMDLPNILIPSLIQCGVDGILYGAGNIRFIGRLAMLYPTNFISIQHLINDNVGELDALDTKKASELFSSGYGNPVSVALDDQISVYVVGSLCGGTASGCFVDFGYMLQELSSRLSQNSTGIFLLPSHAETQKLLVANAVAGLIELNHFSDRRNSYQAQFPHRPGSPWRAHPGAAPYRYTYLAQARNIAKNELARLITATADYIMADIIGPLGPAKLAERVNMASFFPLPDKWGRSQKYLTFGQSIIEFPFIKVAKACGLKFTLNAFRRLAKIDPLPGYMLDEILKKNPLLDSSKLFARLTCMPDSSSIDVMVDSIKNRLRTLAVKSIEALDALTQQLEIAFKGGDSSMALPELPPSVFPNAIERNAAEALNNLQESIFKTVKELLRGEASVGIGGVISFLEEVQKKTAPREHINIDISEIIQRLLVELVDKRAEIVTIINNPVMKPSFWKRLFRKPKYADFVTPLTEDYFITLTELCGMRTQSETQKRSDDIYKHIHELATRLLQRINGPACGMARELSQIIDKYQELYQATDVASDDGSGWGRVVSGYELFTPGVTVDQEYRLCLYDYAKDHGITSNNIDEIEGWIANVVTYQYIDDAIAALTTNPRQIGRYDAEDGKTLSEANDNELKEWMQQARVIFAEMNKHTIVDRLVNGSGGNIKPILQSCIGAADCSLELPTFHPSYDDAPQKRYRFIAYNMDDSSASRLHTELDLAGAFANDGGKPVREINTDNKQQIFFLHERGAFSIGLNEQLADTHSRWWSYYKNSPISDLRSRGDIGVLDWTTWLQQDNNDTEAIETFLVSVALGISEFQAFTVYHFKHDPRTPADTGITVFSNNLDSVGKQLKENWLLQALKRSISDFRCDNEDPSIMKMKKIDTFIKDFNVNQFIEQGISLEKKKLEDLFYEYMCRDIVLKEAWERLYPDKTLTSIRDADGFYCCPNQQCRVRLGKTVDDLYYPDEYGKSVRQCPVCKQSL